MIDHQSKHVFISYVRENQEQVDRLCQDLESHGVNVWLDRNSIKPGARWKDAIQQAIRHGDFFIACFSDEYTSKIKSYMNEELTLAIGELRKYASDREWFIPVLLSECDVPARDIGAGETLLDINWVALHEDWEAGIKRIISVIKPIPPEIQNLTSALRSDDRDVRSRAVEALEKISFEAVPTLIEALIDENEYVRSKAAEALGRIGPEAKAALSALIEALKDENDEVRQNVVIAIDRIGPETNAAVAGLIEASNDKNNKVQTLALKSLAMTAGSNAVAALIEILKDEDKWFRWCAADVLGLIGPEAKSAVPALIEALNDENIEVRERVAWTLGRIGPDAKAAVPTLIEALKAQYKYVRLAAANALKNINTPETQKALEEYRKKSKKIL